MLDSRMMSRSSRTQEFGVPRDINPLESHDGQVEGVPGFRISGESGEMGVCVQTVY